MAHYVKNVWVDNVSPVDSAHMTTMENGIAEAADLYYLGDWVAGTYKEGDIVVYNGVAYVAVRQTTATPVPWAAGQASLSYGTTLPSNPVDGQEAVLVDSVTNPTYQWRFRYNAQSTSPYKWEFIGGPPLHVFVGTQENIGALSTWQDLTTVGPRLLVPRAGTYFGCASVQSSGVGGASLLQADLWNGTTSALGFSVAASSPANGSYIPLTMQGAGNISAGGDIRLRYWANANGAFANRSLTITPVRVS